MQPVRETQPAKRVVDRVPAELPELKQNLCAVVVGGVLITDETDELQVCEWI